MRPSPDLPPPLGATVHDAGTSFAVYAGAAEAVDLVLFEPGDTAGTSERRVPLTDRVHGVWFGDVPGVGPGQRYGFRAHGPWQPQRGLRYNPAKLLVDPYAHAVEGEVALVPAVFGHAVSEDFWGSPDVRDDRDSAPYVPRSVVVRSDFDWSGERRERVPWGDTVVYETHVKGMTMTHPEVPERIRGTYAGMAHPAVVEHLLALGVTTVELLPIQAIAHEVHLARSGRTNYWGYNTLAFFAPHPGYAAATHPQGVVDEVKTMIREYHRHGLEVVLDVVYNHTAEASNEGPTLSLRGLDNATYYRLDERGHNIDVTGCGNTVDLREPHACALVLDSLRHWVTEYHVDGFRFDLAVALGRGRYDDYDPGNPFLVALRTDPVLSRVKLIAEPWDVGVHGWRTGQFPPPFAEWNDRFRDTVRTFWLPDVAAASAHGHGVRELATRLAGSQDLFGHADRRPSASINYIASHDGFPMADTTTYDWKHNEANGEHNRDGHGDNRSWNHGVEGPTDDPAILARRRRSHRNLLGTLFCSTGTPMLLAGDEFARTQWGNNNAYCQDNELSWLDWRCAESERDLVATTQFLTHLRRSFPVLRQNDFFDSTPLPGDGRVDVLWFGRYGVPLTNASWEDPRCRVLQMLLVGDDIDADSLLVVFQGKHEDEDVTLPTTPKGPDGYELLWDSAWERPGPRERHRAGTTVTMTAASLRVYVVTD